MAIYCEKCGKPLSDTAQFCTGCGTPVKKDEIHSFSANQQPQVVYVPQPVKSDFDPSTNSGAHKIIGFLMFAASIFQIICLGFMNIMSTRWDDISFFNYFRITRSKSFMDFAKAIREAKEDGITEENWVLIGAAAVFMLFFLIALLEFMLPQKSDPKYLRKVRNGWLVMFFGNVITVFLHVIALLWMNGDLKNEAVDDIVKFIDALEFNGWFYASAILSIIVLLGSLIMIGVYGELRKQEMRLSPIYQKYNKEVEMLRSNAICRNIFDPYHSKNVLLRVLSVIFILLGVIFGGMPEPGFSLGALPIILLFLLFSCLLFFSNKYTDTDYIKLKFRGWVFALLAGILNIVKLGISAISHTKETSIIVVGLIMSIVCIIISCIEVSILAKYKKRDNKG